MNGELAWRKDIDERVYAFVGFLRAVAGSMVPVNGTGVARESALVPAFGTDAFRKWVNTLAVVQPRFFQHEAALEAKMKAERRVRVLTMHLTKRSKL